MMDKYIGYEMTQFLLWHLIFHDLLDFIGSVFNMPVCSVVFDLACLLVTNASGGGSHFAFRYRYIRTKYMVLLILCLLS